MITKIHFENTNDYIINGVENNSLTNLNRINIFIGPNNSGKSRFIRRLLIDDNLNVDIKQINNTLVIDTLKKALQDIDEQYNIFGVEDTNEIKLRLKGLIDSDKYNYRETTSFISRIRNFCHDLSNIPVSSPKRKDKRIIVSGTDWSVLQESLRFIGRKLTNDFDLILPQEFDAELSKIYIPILRGLRPIQIRETNNDGHDNYKARTIKDYFAGIEYIENKIFTGLSLYEDTRKLLLSKIDERKKIKDFETFLSDTFFRSQTVSLIPNINSDVLYIGIGEEPERPIYELGDGIQSIIVMLYPLFFNQGKKLCVFIEEPEISLHPGMQRIFLETLLKPQFETFQYFITTHSNHFLDLTLDLSQLSVFTFHKQTDKQKYLIENTSNEDIKILDLIGIRNSSIFLSNCTIWVEGITDRLYLKKYLEVYCQSLNNTEFKEDIHYSFVEYGGGNIVHWSFSDDDSWENIKALSISNKILLLADEDGTQGTLSAKTDRIRRLEKNLKENFSLIGGREIENTLSEDVLIKTIAEKEKVSVTSLAIKTSSFKNEKYIDKKIGDFIEKNIANLKGSYRASSGTIKNKVEFCKKAITHIQTIDDLSIVGKEIAKKIFEFIQRSNSN